MMNRGYSREWYLDKIKSIRTILGEECGISSDMITGFCSETEAEHEDTLSLMDLVKYDYAYMFFYSERPGTLAEKKFADDVPLDIKKRRLNEIIQRQTEHALERNKKDVGKVHKVLIEGTSKRSEDFLQGRNSAYKVVIFPKENFQKGQYVNVLVDDYSRGTLFGKVVHS
jgi:tRNA-2-methylthio-N6-dimethylallyladenosine synthase